MSSFIDTIMDVTGLLKELALLTRTYERFIILEDKMFDDVIGTNDAQGIKLFPNRSNSELREKEKEKKKESGEPYEVFEKKVVCADDDLYVFCTQWICCSRPRVVLQPSSNGARATTPNSKYVKSTQVILFATGGRRDVSTWKMSTFSRNGGNDSSDIDLAVNTTVDRNAASITSSAVTSTSHYVTPTTIYLHSAASPASIFRFCRLTNLWKQRLNLGSVFLGHSLISHQRSSQLDISNLHNLDAKVDITDEKGLVLFSGSGLTVNRGLYYFADKNPTNLRTQYRFDVRDFSDVLFSVEFDGGRAYVIDQISYPVYALEHRILDLESGHVTQLIVSPQIKAVRSLTVDRYSGNLLAVGLSGRLFEFNIWKLSWAPTMDFIFSPSGPDNLTSFTVLSK